MKAFEHLAGTGAVVAAVCLGGLWGCADNTPAKISVASPSLKLLDETPHSLGVQLVNSKGDALPEPALSFSATPSAVLEVRQDGSVACKETGDASVIAAGGGQSATVTVNCRMVKTIRLPLEVRLVVGRESGALAVAALDRSGRELPDVAVELETGDPQIATIANGEVTPVSAGRTRVTARAGRATAVVPVLVVELIQSRPIALSDGAAETWALQRGTYELELVVKASNGTHNGVAVSWVGADCPDSRESPNHRLACTVGSTASLTVRNPSLLGLGPAVHGYINLFRSRPQ